jgi:glycosyltransferase involved in cell wall biosynthesis
MKIAFDAKRAYQNTTGLGNYSRTLISSLATFHNQHSYYLCSPKPTNLFDVSTFSNIENIVPENFLAQTLRSAWRSNWVKKDLQKKAIHIYHGLSNEIPIGIQKTQVRSVVTIHDLIFERYPEQYNFIDVKIYRQKFRYACRNANHIIAISNQTKQDLIDFYNIAEDKITVCYQSCNPAFSKNIDDAEKKRIKSKYNLPENFFYM